MDAGKVAEAFQELLLIQMNSVHGNVRSDMEDCVV